MAFSISAVVDFSSQVTPSVVETNTTNITLVFNVSNLNITGNVTNVTIEVPSGFAFINGTNSTTNPNSSFMNSTVNLTWYNNSQVALIAPLGSENFTFNVTITGSAGVYQFNVYVFDNESGMNFAQVNISVIRGCGSTITTNLTLVQNFSTGSTCFTIGAENITIDGAGFVISSNTTGYGIHNPDGYDSITIKNFGGIKNFSIGINGSEMTNSTIFNNTIITNSTNGYGISLVNSSSYNNISFNNITTFGSLGIPIYVRTGSNYCNVTSNTMVTYSSASGIWCQTDYNTILRNNITTSTGTGIRVNSNNTVAYNIISATGTSTFGITIGVDRNNITYNTITTNGSQAYGIYVTASTERNNITYNTINTLGSEACGLYEAGAYFTTLEYNNITTSNETDAYAVYMDAPENITLFGDRLDAGNNSEFYITGTTNVNITNVIMGDINFTSHNVPAEIFIGANETQPTAPTGNTSLGDYLTINMSATTAGIEFNFSYTASDLTGFTESSIKIYKYNDSAGAWTALPNSSFDTTRNVAYSGNVSTSSTNTFASFGIYTAPCTTCNGAFPSGSSFDAGPSTPKVVGVWPSLDEDLNGTMTITNDLIGITEISFDVVRDITNARLVVESLSQDKPENISAPPGIIYEYLELTPTNLAATDISNIKIRFRVNKTWIGENDVDKNTVALYRYTNSWNKLTTVLVSEDANYSVYEGDTLGFSTFVIIGEVAAAQVCTPGAKQCVGNDLQQCNSDGSAWETAETCQYGCDSTNLVCYSEAQPVCTAGAKRCVGNSLEQCSSDGMQWTVSETCDYQCLDRACIERPITPQDYTYIIIIIVVVLIIAGVYLKYDHKFLKKRI